jgi:hypothetical protein
MRNVGPAPSNKNKSHPIEDVVPKDIASLEILGLVGAELAVGWLSLEAAAYWLNLAHGIWQA